MRPAVKISPERRKGRAKIGRSPQMSQFSKEGGQPIYRSRHFKKVKIKRVSNKKEAESKK
jgi:hypothetical protein